MTIKVLVPLSVVLLAGLWMTGDSLLRSDSTPSKNEVSTDRTRDAEPPVTAAEPAPDVPSRSATPPVDRSAIAGGGVRVQVLDHHGEPVAGIPLRVDQIIPDRPANLTQSAGYEVLWEGESGGSEGLAVLPVDLPWQAEAVAGRVIANIYTVAPVVAQFDRDRDSAEPLVLRLPPLSQIDVRVLTPEGIDSRASGTVSLGLAVSERQSRSQSRQQPGWVPDLPLWRPYKGVRRLVDGSARFRFVGTGLALEVTAELDIIGRNSDHPRQAVESPVTPGQTVNVNLRLDRPAIRGRLFLPDGSVCANTEILVGCVWERKRTVQSRRLRLRTDPAGWLQLHGSLPTPAEAKVPPRVSLLLLMSEE